MTVPIEHPISSGSSNQPTRQIYAEVGNDAHNVIIGDNNQQQIFEHVEQVIIQQPIASASGSPAPIPNLLICKVNRELQERDLVRAIGTLSPESTQPFICIIHGGEHEAHDSFVKRLSHDYLPKQMHLSFMPGVKPFPLPSDLEDVNLLAEEIKRKLSEKICGDWHTPPDLINQKLHRDGTCVLYTVLYHEDLRKLGFAIVEEFIRYWQTWPTLATGQVLFVCLCIRYRLGDEESSREGFLRRFLARAKPLLPIHQVLEEALSVFDFGQYERLTGTPLPRLDPVEHRHIEKWADREETQEFFNSAGIRVHELMAEVQTLYDAHGSKERPVRIPMDIVEENLSKIIEKFQQGQAT